MAQLFRGWAWSSSFAVPYACLTRLYSDECAGGLDTGNTTRPQRAACRVTFGFAPYLGSSFHGREAVPKFHPPQALGGSPMKKFVRFLWSNQDGQDIAEYAVMLAVILVIVVGTIRLVGSNANNTFSSVASAIQ